MSDATTNERIARLCGWQLLDDGSGYPPGHHGDAAYDMWLPDYTTSLDALCGKDGPVVWAAQWYSLNEVEVSKWQTAELWDGHAALWPRAGGKVIRRNCSQADTLQHALAGAICAAVLALAEKLGVK